MLVAQNADTAVAAPPLANNFPHPVAQRKPPVASHHDAAKDVDNLDQEAKETVAGLRDAQHDGLDVVLEEDAGDLVVRDDLALLRDGVLVGVDDPVACEVDGGDDGEEVLELVEVNNGGVDGAVEGVDQRWVKGAVGHFRYDVREVEL